MQILRFMLLVLFSICIFSLLFPVVSMVSGCAFFLVSRGQVFGSLMIDQV